jgi:hypothetical protein
MAVVPLFGLLAAAALIVAARTYEKDLRDVAALEPAAATNLELQPA